jgi:hypothetical protein
VEFGWSCDGKVLNGRKDRGAFVSGLEVGEGKVENSANFWSEKRLDVELSYNSETVAGSTKGLLTS